MESVQPALLGLPWRAFVWATAVAVVVAALYTLSPITVLFVPAMVLLFKRAGQGLAERERRWVLALLGAALLLRILAIAALFVVADHGYTDFFGDGGYAKARSLWITNFWSGVSIAPGDLETAFLHGPGWSGYLYILAYMQILLGPAPYGIHLFNVGLFLVGAVMLHRLARSAYGPLPALGVLSLTLFLPSLLAWSTSAIKESVYFFLIMVVLCAVVQIVRGENWRKRFLAMAILAPAVAVVSTVRVGALTILTVSIGSALVLRLATLKWWLFAVFLTSGTLAGYSLLSRPAVQERIMGQLRQAAVYHRGHVTTPGHTYKLLDQRLYSGGRSTIDSMTRMEAVRFVIRAGVGFVVFPLPWHLSSLTLLAFLPQQILWYILVVLAVPGVIRGLRRDPLVTFVLAGYILAAAATVALHTGNFGTMIRHRDLVVPFLSCFSALGVLSVLPRRS